jgi:hypothetical protein
MITEDYVSFETAKLLKEKGFDERTDTSYIIDNTDRPMVKIGDLIYSPNTEPHRIAAPTLQMAMKWLRKKYEYIILFDVSAWGTYDWYYIYKGNRYHYDDRTFEYNEMEEAAENAIKYCIEKLI